MFRNKYNVEKEQETGEQVYGHAHSLLFTSLSLSLPASFMLVDASHKPSCDLFHARSQTLYEAADVLSSDSLQILEPGHSRTLRVEPRLGN